MTPLGCARPRRAARAVARALAAGTLAGAVGARAAPPPDRPNVVFILIDTLRADHLSCYGYPRPTSPHIDAIAADGVLFRAAYTVCPWTNPTIATLFTGRYPQAVFAPAAHREAIRQRLPAELDTLAEILGRHGYHTSALVDHPGLSAKLGYAQGFARYRMLYARDGYHRWQGTAPAAVREQIVAELDALPRPFFLYLHLVYPHRPHTPPAPYAGQFGPGFQELNRRERDGVINMYDAEIRQTDDLIGAVFDHLAARALVAHTHLVLTSDHGEGFWEHGLAEHGNSLYDELLHVPLIVRPAGGRGAAPAQVDAPVSLVDVFPSLLALAGAPVPPATPGQSWAGWLSGDPPAVAERTLFSENLHTGNVDAAASMTGRFKLVDYPGPWLARELFFDREHDPTERRSIADELPARHRLKARLAAHRAAAVQARAAIPVHRVELDAGTRERLRALGYDD
jgi:arylsulfatase A-like enzyme